MSEEQQKEDKLPGWVIDRLAWLDALESAGVDNWEGIDEALRIYEEGL